MQHEQKAAAIERKETAEEQKMVRKTRQGLLPERPRANGLLERKRRDVLEWLSVYDFTVRLSTLQMTRVENTGLWFLKDSGLLSWLGGESKSLLWCSGIGNFLLV